jgi:osmotically inducible protein OsmC
MSVFSRKVDVLWNGGIMDGKGEAKAGTGAFSLPVTFPSRVESPEGRTSPEELIAAAHAAGYAMALSATLGRQNASAERLDVSATVQADLGEGGIKIHTSRLRVKATGLKGLDAGRFAEVAREAETKCPVSNALRGGLKVDVEAVAG